MELSESIGLTKQARAYEAIKHAIIAGEFKPLDSVSERAVGEKLGLSRTPIREAIRQLVAEGWLESVPGIGTFVPKIKKNELTDFYMVRGRQDGFAFRLCAENQNPNVILELKHILNKMAKDFEEGNFERHAELDIEFHEACVKGSGNHALWEVYKVIQGHLQRMYYFRVETEEFIIHKINTMHRYEEILAAIEAGDGELAEQLGHENMEKILEFRNTYIRDTYD